jgi:hypothetical protein
MQMGYQHGSKLNMVIMMEYGQVPLMLQFDSQFQVHGPCMFSLVCCFKL